MAEAPDDPPDDAGPPPNPVPASKPPSTTTVGRALDRRAKTTVIKHDEVHENWTLEIPRSIEGSDPEIAMGTIHQAFLEEFLKKAADEVTFLPTSRAEERPESFSEISKFPTSSSAHRRFFHSEETLTALIGRAAHDAQLWRDLLFASGGDLELLKCYFYCLWIDYTASGKAYLRPGTL